MPDEKPLVSVVVPVYNQEQYLDRSIPALLNQELEDIQIVAVDDGSTDDSPEILEKYSDLDPRVTVVHKGNGGLVSATITGIESACGDFIAFVDPDDTVGYDYLSTLIAAMDNGVDVVSAGYFYSEGQVLTGFPLRNQTTYQDEKLDFLRKYYIISPDSAGMSDLCAIPRWNKLYRKECVERILPRFRRCTDITLGEDSIFTYLCLSAAKSVRCLDLVNSYYYTVGNAHRSMMSNSSADSHVAQAKKAFVRLRDFLREDGMPESSAYALLYREIQSLLIRLCDDEAKTFYSAYKKVRKDRDYVQALSLMNKLSSTSKDRLRIGVERYSLRGKLYRYIYGSGKQQLRSCARSCKDILQFFKDFRSSGLARAKKRQWFRKTRNNAFTDLNQQLPKLEHKIRPMLQKYRGQTTNIVSETIPQKVFVLWWDGFENAPEIVKSCRKSLQTGFPNAKIIELTKNNFRDFTDIDERIIDGLNNEKISIQTFSDILRFNVLKNNGGAWVDATLFFAEPSNLLSNLAQKPFESLAFSTSSKYLQYKGEYCNWSGFFISSRKNSVLTQAMDYVFQSYYLKYGGYPIYFFIDALFMLCKLEGIDNSAISKIQNVPGNMFELVSLLNLKGHEEYLRRKPAVPQKLYWGYQSNESCADSTYRMIVEGN